MHGAAMLVMSVPLTAADTPGEGIGMAEEDEEACVVVADGTENRVPVFEDRPLDPENGAFDVTNPVLGGLGCMSG